MPETVFWSDYEANFNVTWNEHQSKVQEIMARADVLGIMVHDYHVRLQDDDWQLAGMTIRIPAVTRPADEQRLFDRLSTLYTYGLPNQNEASSRPLILP